MPEQHDYSGVFYRILAYLLDGLLTMGFFIGIPLLLPDTRTGIILESVIMTIIGIAYYLVFESIWSASPGKKIMGLKMLTTNFEPITMKHILVRRSIPFLLSFVGVIAQIVAIKGLSDEVVADLALGMFDPKKQAASQALLAANPLGLFAYVLTGIVFLEGMVLLVNKKRQAVHDMIAGTIVVHK